MMGQAGNWQRVSAGAHSVPRRVNRKQGTWEGSRVQTKRPRASPKRIATGLKHDQVENPGKHSAVIDRTSSFSSCTYFFRLE